MFSLFPTLSPSLLPSLPPFLPSLLLLSFSFLQIWGKSRPHIGDFPVVQWLRTLLSNMGLLCGPGTKIPHVEGHLSHVQDEREATHRKERSCMLQLRPDAD